MDLAQFGLILRARWRVIAIGLIIGLLIGFLWVLTSNKTYLASAKVLLSVRAPDTVGTEQITPQLTPDYLSTQADIIRSDRVALEVVKAMKLNDDQEALAAYRAAGAPGTIEQFYVGQVRRGLNLIPSSTSRVISIDYVSDDPVKAATFANAFADAYRNVSLELTIDPARQSSRYFQQSADEVSKQLADAQATLSKRRADLGVTAPSDQMDAEDARLSALSQQLATAEATRAVQSARAGAGALPDIMASSVVASLQSDIARLEAQRSQMATYAGPNNVDYMQITNQLAAMRRQLGQQEALVSRSAAASSAQSSQSVASLQGAVSSQRARVISAQRARGELSALEQRVTNLRETFNQIMSRQAQSTLLGAMSQTNVTLLSPATPPSGPANTPAILKLLACAFAGLLAGGIIAAALELLDQRFRRPEDASVWLGIPNLGGVRQLGPPGRTAIGGTVRRYLPGPSKAYPNE